jgi:hypothetical protein
MVNGLADHHGILHDDSQRPDEAKREILFSVRPNASMRARVPRLHWACQLIRELRRLSRNSSG